MFNVTSQFSINYKEILIDEIALEGLEGIGINSLWNRVSHRISSTVTNKMVAQFWNIILTMEHIEFYKLPVPVVEIKVVDRFSIIDEESGHLKDPDYYLDGPYNYNLVKKNNVHGSCEHYETRTQISRDEIKDLPYEQILNEYSENLVMVASQEERWRALACHVPITYLDVLTPLHYCILELVGKSRDNGQMSVGLTNLTKIVKDSKFLFYNRNRLQQLDLIYIVHLNQIVDGRCTKSILLRLKRFHRSKSMSIPSQGLIHNITQYLRTKPEFKETIEVLAQKSILPKTNLNKLKKSFNNFKIVEEKVIVKSYGETPLKKRKIADKKLVCLITESDESSGSDAENEISPLKCQYTIGVNLMRQAYEMFMEAGLKGLTQIELGQVLGLEFYTSRAICRVFKAKKLVRGFLEDKGRQRMARYIAIAATGVMDKKYADEKNKFLEYLDTTNDLVDSSGTKVTGENSNPLIKESKENSIKTENNENPPESNEDITELQSLQGIAPTTSYSETLLKAKKGPSLRQLKFANGIIKVVREKLTVASFQKLSKIVAKDIDQPPMDTKSLKRIVQRLAADGQLHIYKLSWPGFKNRYSILICAPHIKISNPSVQTAYKEIVLQSLRHNKDNEPKQEPQQLIQDNYIVSFKSFPRYKKAAKLHEFIFQLAYEQSGVEISEAHLPHGCISLLRMIPEMTTSLALGHLGPNNISDVHIAKKHECFLDMKLSEVPSYIRRAILNIKSFVVSLKANLKILASFGLIQLCGQCSSIRSLDYTTCPNRYVFFVNRHATIINTTGAWPRPVANIKNLEIKFYLQNFSDVKRYWNTLYDVSTNTIVKVAKRSRDIPHAPIRTPENVVACDNGDIYGDKSGPGGMHSAYFLEKSRFWQVFNVFKCKQKLKPRSKVPEFKMYKPKTKKKSKTRAKETARVKVKPQKKVQQLKGRRSRHADVSTWNKWEDEILTMVSAARMIMSPNTQPGSLQISNYVAKDIIAVRNKTKTGAHCHKRIMTLERTSTLTHNRECIVNEVRRRRHLIEKYEGLFKKIRMKYSTKLMKYITEGRLRMMELVWIIAQVVKRNTFRNKMACVAQDIDDFHNKFMITSQEKRLSSTYLNQNDNKDPIRVATITEAILLTVNAFYNEELTKMQSQTIYNIFGKYPEDIIRIAIEQLRKSGAVAAREKSLNNHYFKYSCKDITQYTSSYRVSAVYERRWGNKFNADFIKKLGNAARTLLPTDNIESSPEICCLLCEQHANGVIDIKMITEPIVAGPSFTEEELSVAETENKFKFQPGTTTWSHTDGTPKTIINYYTDMDVTNVFSKLLRNAVIVKSSNEHIIEGDLLQYLESKCELGTTFDELKNKFNCDTEQLRALLADLEEKAVIKRTGFFETNIVLYKFIEPWTITIDNTTIIPSPWISLDVDIKPTIFVNWSGTVMNKIFESPGCSILNIADSCEFLAAKHVLDISIVLHEHKCVLLKTVEVAETTLFSDDDVCPKLVEFNPYASTEYILVFPVKDSLTRYSILREKLLNKM